jgi:hypothetical protein
LLPIFGWEKKTSNYQKMFANGVNGNTEQVEIFSESKTESRENGEV